MKDAKTPQAMLDELEKLLSSLGGALVAYSGGVDSSLLAVAAGRALGDRAVCVTGISPSVPARELKLAEEIVSQFGLRHIETQVNELSCKAYSVNGPDRCYHCKGELFKTLRGIAKTEGVEWILDGNNADDAGDYRPGRKAAKEAGVRSPLMELSFTKEDVRAMSRLLGLPTADKPAQACLSSRLAYGVEITKEALERVEKAEDFLLSLGFGNVRVRVHQGDLARIEVPEGEIAKLACDELRRKVFEKLKALGFVHVSLDLKGYRTGSMNEALGEGARPS